MLLKQLKKPQERTYRFSLNTSDYFVCLNTQIRLKIKVKIAVFQKQFLPILLSNIIKFDLPDQSKRGLNEGNFQQREH